MLMRVEDGSVSVLVQRRTLVDEIIDGGGVRAVYQPIVELGSGAVVAYESLARGPVDTALERPDLLFTAAREVGRVADLDWACRAAAVRGALAAGLSTDVGLFVNVEPRSPTPCGVSWPTPAACGCSSRSPSARCSRTRPGCWSGWPASGSSDGALPSTTSGPAPTRWP
jgi:hypothetical protein